MDAPSYFRGKRITVMGLGLLGRGIGDVRYLAECGAELLVTDLKTNEALAEALIQLRDFPNIQYTLGEHKLEDFNNRDLVLKAAGVPLDSPYIAEAMKNKIPVRMSADLFAELSGVTCVGVTGTRGKSTVTHMIAEILRTANKKVLLGGNVRGVSNLQLLKEATPEHIAVLELDSWQLQGFSDAKISPKYAVFTTFYPDHLNYYNNDLDIYLADKANIFLYQKLEDTLVLGPQCKELVQKKYGSQIKSRIITPSELPSDWILSIPGIHNRYNASLALAAARALGISDDMSRKALELFAGVHGRLEFIREINGVKIYNDTTSTTPEASLAALEALGTKNTVLIAGGTDKNLELTGLVAKMREAKHIILLSGSGTDRIVNSLQEAGSSKIHGPYTKLSRAVMKAFELSESGDTILFSPAFTSFGMFKNEYDRGDQFNALVKELS